MKHALLTVLLTQAGYLGYIGNDSYASRAIYHADTKSVNINSDDFADLEWVCFDDAVPNDGTGECYRLKETFHDTDTRTTYVPVETFSAPFGLNDVDFVCVDDIKCFKAIAE